MANDPAEARKMSPAEFVEWEASQLDKHELHEGEPYAMAGGSPRHNKLTSRITGILERELHGSPCEALESNQMLSVATKAGYVYADVSMVCGQLELHPVGQALLNPAAIFEILSRSTERFDRGDKYRLYRARPSLRDYVLVSQREAYIEHHQLLDGRWTLVEAGAEATITLSDGVSLVVAEIYSGVWRFPADVDDPA